MGLRESSLMGCHLKYIEASASEKQNLSGAVKHPPLAVTSEALPFSFSCYNFVVSWVPAYWDCKIT